MVNIEEIAQELNDCMDYAETGDVSKAKRFVTAAKRYLTFRPTQSSHPGGFAMAFDVNNLKMLLDEANYFLTANQNRTTTSNASILGVRHGSR